MSFVIVSNVQAQLSSPEKHIVDSLKQVSQTASYDTTRVKALDAWDGYIYYFDSELDLHLNSEIEKICVYNLSKKICFYLSCENKT